MVQTAVGSNWMVVAIHIFPEQLVQVTFIQRDYVIEQFAAQRAYHSLGVGILPWRFEGRSDFLDSTALKKCRHAAAIDFVVVSDDISGLKSKPGRLTELMNHPEHGRMLGNTKSDDLSPLVVHYNKDIQ